MRTREVSLSPSSMSWMISCPMWWQTSLATTYARSSSKSLPFRVWSSSCTPASHRWSRSPWTCMERAPCKFLSRFSDRTPTLFTRRSWLWVPRCRNIFLASRRTLMVTTSSKNSCSLLRHQTRQKTRMILALSNLPNIRSLSLLRAWPIVSRLALTSTDAASCNDASKRD